MLDLFGFYGYKTCDNIYIITYYIIAGVKKQQKFLILIVRDGINWTLLEEFFIMPIQTKSQHLMAGKVEFLIYWTNLQKKWASNQEGVQISNNDKSYLTKPIVIKKKK